MLRHRTERVSLSVVLWPGQLVPGPKEPWAACRWRLRGRAQPVLLLLAQVQNSLNVEVADFLDTCVLQGDDSSALRWRSSPEPTPPRTHVGFRQWRTAVLTTRRLGAPPAWQDLSRRGNAFDEETMQENVCMTSLLGPHPNFTASVLACPTSSGIRSTPSEACTPFRCRRTAERPWEQERNRRTCA